RPGGPSTRPIWVRLPTGFPRPRRTASTPATNEVARAPRPTVRTPSLPEAGAGRVGSNGALVSGAFIHPPVRRLTDGKERRLLLESPRAEPPLRKGRSGGWRNSRYAAAGRPSRWASRRCAGP